jgi:hypothetical protein
MALKRESPTSASHSGPEFSTPKKKSKANNTQTSPKTSPKHKWTDDEIRIVVELRKQGLTSEYLSSTGKSYIREIATTHFPGRTTNAIQIIYQRHSKEVVEVFTPEKVIVYKFESTIDFRLRN